MYKLEEIKKILNIKEQEENKDSWTDEEASEPRIVTGKLFYFRIYLSTNP